MKMDELGCRVEARLPEWFTNTRAFYLILLCMIFLSGGM